MWPNPQFPAGLVKFTEKFLMENLIFCAVKKNFNHFLNTNQRLRVKNLQNKVE